MAYSCAMGFTTYIKKSFVLAAFHLQKWHFVKRKRRKKNIEAPRVVTFNFAPLYFRESWRSKHEKRRFQIVRTSTFYGKIEAELQPAWKTAWQFWSELDDVSSLKEWKSKEVQALKGNFLRVCFMDSHQELTVFGDRRLVSVSTVKWSNGWSWFILFSRAAEGPGGSEVVWRGCNFPPLTSKQWL